MFSHFVAELAEFWSARATPKQQWNLRRSPVYTLPA